MRSTRDRGGSSACAQGFSAFQHHVPDRGNMMLCFGPSLLRSSPDSDDLRLPHSLQRLQQLVADHTRGIFVADEQAVRPLGDWWP